MADNNWRSRATPINTNDWRSRSELLTPDSSGEEPGMVESGLRGLEQGATLGFGDEINGGLSTLLDTITGRNKNLSIMDDYAKQRDESRAAMEAAEKAHPYISGAANLAGGLAPALLTGGASLPEQGLAGAAKLGAAYGALGGLGSSKADLTKGQVGQALKDTATGGVLGGLVGGAVHTGAEAFGDTLNKAGVTLGGAAKSIAEIPGELPMVAEPLESFKQGLGGQKLFGVKANRDLQQQFIDASKGLTSSLETAENAATGAKTKALLGAQERIDMEPWMKDYGSMFGNLQKYESADPQVAQELQRVDEYVRRFVGGNEESGLIGKASDGSIAPADLDRFRQKLAEWSSAGDNALKTKEARTLVTRLLSPLKRDPNITEAGLGIPEGFNPIKTMLTDSIPSLEGYNKTISSIEQAKEVMPNINDLMNVEKTSQSGTTALDAFQKFFDTAPEDVVGDQKDKFLDLAKARDISNKISAPGLSHGFLANTVRGTALTGANMVGLGLNGLYHMAPEAIQSLSQKVAEQGSEAAKKLAMVLQNASQKDNVGRNALFFAIQQNPEYRKILQNASGGQQPAQ